MFSSYIAYHTCKFEEQGHGVVTKLPPIASVQSRRINLVLKLLFREPPIRDFFLLDDPLLTDHRDATMPNVSGVVGIQSKASATIAQPHIIVW